MIRPHFDVDAFNDAPDIAEASFGPRSWGLRARRERVSETRENPWRMVASLAIIAADWSRWTGTAWFAGPRTLVTAAHCLYVRGSGVPGRDGWVRSVTVMPARDGSELPFGAAVVRPSGMRVAPGWSEGGGVGPGAQDQGSQGQGALNLGALILDEPLGERTGWLPTTPSGSGVFGEEIVTVGYAGGSEPGILWREKVTLERVGADHIGVLGRPGASGSPVFASGRRQTYAIAVVSTPDGGVTTAHRVGGDLDSTIDGWERPAASTRARR